MSRKRGKRSFELARFDSPNHFQGISLGVLKRFSISGMPWPSFRQGTYRNWAQCSSLKKFSSSVLLPLSIASHPPLCDAGIQSVNSSLFPRLVKGTPEKRISLSSLRIDSFRV